MIVGGVQMFLGFDPASEGWALREVTSLCGLSLGGHRGVEQDRARTEPSPEPAEPRRFRNGLRVVVSNPRV